MRRLLAARTVGLFASLALLTGCASNPPPTLVLDPFAPMADPAEP